MHHTAHEHRITPITYNGRPVWAVDPAGNGESGPLAGTFVEFTIHAGETACIIDIDGSPYVTRLAGIAFDNCRIAIDADDPSNPYEDGSLDHVVYQYGLVGMKTIPTYTTNESETAFRLGRERRAELLQQAAGII